MKQPDAAPVSARAPTSHGREGTAEQQQFRVALVGERCHDQLDNERHGEAGGGNDPEPGGGEAKAVL